MVPGLFKESMYPSMIGVKHSCNLVQLKALIHLPQVITVFTIKRIIETGVLVCIYKFILGCGIIKRTSYLTIYVYLSSIAEAV